MTSPWPSRARAVLLSLLLLAFVTGIAAGVAGDRFMAPRARLVIQTDIAGVLDRLELSPDQRRQADSIVARSAPRSHAIMMETAERLRAVADSVDRELRGLLTEVQRRRLDSMRTGSRIMLKRKPTGSEGVRVDTLLDTSANARPRR